MKTAAALVIAAVLAGCGGGGKGQAQAQGAPGGGPGARPAQPPVPVAVKPAEVGTISSYYTATATLAAEKQAEILARVAGVVKERRCEEGDVVNAGDVLLVIDNGEYKFKLEQAEANRKDLESKFDRMQKMIDQNLVSAEEFETLKNNLESARAAEGLARLNLSYTEVKAPFRGRIVQRNVDVGQTVNVGTSLFVLSDFDPLLARIHVPSKEFNKLAPDQPVDLVLESDGTHLKGKITLISPVIDPTSGTIKVTVEIHKYPEHVRPGDFAQVRIVTERRTGATLVPKIAVVTDRGEQVVFVAADSTAERRAVQVGFQDDDNAQILTGVKPGESVIVRGQRSLKHGQRIRILESSSVADTSPAAREGS